MSPAMESPSSFQETEAGSTLRLEWDNRRVRKDRFTYWFLAIFWIIWAPVTVFVTERFLADVFAKAFHLGVLVSGLPAVIWLIFGWLGTLLIPWCLLGRSWREWIEISEEEVCHGREGLLAPKPKHFPIARIECFFGL